MKKILAKLLIYGVISSLFIFGLLACSQTASPTFSQTVQLGSGKLVDNYKSIDDLIKDSPIIIIGTVSSANEEFVYKDVTFALTKFKVETIIRGDVPETINILQTVISEDPLIKKGDKMIMFLKKYTGPVAEDAYRFKGSYMGQYKIEDEKIIKNEQNKLTGDNVLESLQTLETRVNEIGYEPVSTNSISK